MENDSMSIDSNDSNFNSNRRTVDAFVKKLTSKPRIKNERWLLSTEIEQTNGTIMEVSFADTVSSSQPSFGRDSD